MPKAAPDSAEFENLIEALGNDLASAAIHLRLYKDLRAAVPSYLREFNESNTFWQLTLTAHLQHGLHSLARAYDQERSSSLSLRRWLETIRENLHLFEADRFRERLKDNQFVSSLAEHVRPPDVKTLDEHIAYCSGTNPLVQRLVIIRNNALAHRSYHHASRGQSAYTDYPLSFDTLDELVDKGFLIYNTYNQLFRAVQQSRQIIGHDDFLHVLDAVRRDLQRFEHEIKQEIGSD